MTADVSTAPNTVTPPRAEPSHLGAHATVRRVPTPSWAPPFDDELAVGESGQDVRGLGTALLAVPLPLAAPSATVGRLRVVPQPAGPAPSDLSPAGAWCTRFVRVVLESLAGLRPVSQLGAWANPDVCRLVARRVTSAQRCRDRPRTAGVLLSVHVCAPAPEVAEVCAVVQFDGRVRALALRVETVGGRWRCTDLRVG
jgi:Family of unknown function (DUF6459)